MAKTVGDVVKKNGGWLNVVSHLTTALTPIWVTKMATRSVSATEVKSESNNILSNFVIPSGNKRIDYILGSKKEISVNVIKNLAHEFGDIANSSILEPWNKTVNNISSNVRKIFYGSGISLFKIKDGNSWISDRNKIRAMSIEQKNPQYRTDRVSKIAMQSKNFAEKLRTPGTIENGYLGVYANPKAEGYVNSAFKHGYEGLMDSVRSLPVPPEYADDRHTVMMAYTVASNNKGYIGASIGKCEASQERTLEYMLGRAKELGLNIPARPDGKDWNTCEYIMGLNEQDKNNEMDIFRRCLTGQRNSPFLVSKGMMSESPILIRDKNIIDVAMASENMSVNAINGYIKEWKKDAIKFADKRIDMAASPQEKADAIASKRSIELSPESFTGTIKRIKNEQDKEFVKFQQQAEANSVGIQTQEVNVESLSWNDELAESSWGQDLDNHQLTPIGQMKTVNYPTLKMMGLILSPENTKIKIDDDLGFVSMEVTIGEKERTILGLPELEYVANENSISLHNLSAGVYQTEGKEGASFEIKEKNNTTEMILSGVNHSYNNMRDLVVIKDHPTIGQNHTMNNNFANYK